MKLMNADGILEHDGIVEIEARARTDFFIDQRTGVDKHDAPFAYAEIEGDFVLSALVRPTFRDTYDAGGLFVYDDAARWIKHEFERTDLGCRSIVSVVTDGTSDDCNGERVEAEDEVYLQIIRRGDWWWLHHSADGVTWRMSRYLRLRMGSKVRAGIECQSPLGEGTKAVFRDLRLGNAAIADPRKGR